MPHVVGAYSRFVGFGLFFLGYVGISMAQVNEAANQVSANSSTVNARAEECSRLANQMTELIARFRI